MVLELLKCAPRILDLIHSAIESEPVIVLAARLVVREHAVAILHSEDLIVHATVVSILITQVVQLLPQLGNELVLLARSDLDTHLCLHMHTEC